MVFVIISQKSISTVVRFLHKGKGVTKTVKRKISNVRAF